MKVYKVNMKCDKFNSAYTQIVCLQLQECLLYETA